MSLPVIQLKADANRSKHPWVRLEDLDVSSADLRGAAISATLMDAYGEPLGSGVLDVRDPVACWRRYSLEAEVEYDEAYLATALQDALALRGDEACRRLVSADADYLPGIVVEQFGDVITLQLSSAMAESHRDFLVEFIQEVFAPQEIVLMNNCEVRSSFGLELFVGTVSGRSMKARWIEVDELYYRIDFLNADKPRFFLDQREQHALVGSLCEGRRVLDGFAHSGAFGMQAMRSGAESVVAVDKNEFCTKSIGAVASKNGQRVDTVCADVCDFLQACEVGALDAIVLDPQESFAEVRALHELVFERIAPGGLLATYCRDPQMDAGGFEAMVRAAAITAGREGRLFARIGQPFDHPVLLNLPETAALKGVILQVE